MTWGGRLDFRSLVLGLGCKPQLVLRTRLILPMHAHRHARTRIRSCARARTRAHDKACRPPSTRLQSLYTDSFNGQLRESWLTENFSITSTFMLMLAYLVRGVRNRTNITACTVTICTASYSTVSVLCCVVCAQLRRGGGGGQSRGLHGGAMRHCAVARRAGQPVPRRTGWSRAVSYHEGDVSMMLRCCRSLPYFCCTGNGRHI